MKGIFFSVAAGILICIQSVINTRLGSKIGLWGANVIVHGTGLFVALFIMFFAGGTNFSNLASINKIYLLGGTLGVLIVFSSMVAVSSLGPSFSIATILIVQLIAACLVEYFGLLGTSPITFHPIKILGLILMIAGIIIFKIK